MDCMMVFLVWLLLLMLFAMTEPFMEALPDLEFNYGLLLPTIIFF